MLADFRVVGELPREQLEQLAEALRSAAGFLDPDAVATIVHEHISDESHSRAIRQCLRNLSHDDLDQWIRRADRLRRSGEADVKLADEEMTRVRDNLTLLVQDYPALVRFDKGERLAKQAGPPLESLDLICDARPIYDDRRSEIEGMVPYVRLQVVVTGVDGLPRLTEAVMSAVQLEELVTKATRAQTKLATLAAKIVQSTPAGFPKLWISEGLSAQGAING